MSRTPGPNTVPMMSQDARICRLVSVVAAHPDCTPRTIRALLGWPLSLVEATIANARKAGRIEATTRARGCHPVRVSVVA